MNQDFSLVFSLDSTSQTIFWIGIGIYLAAMLFIGFLCSRKVNSMNDYLVAGRRLPLWMATATLLATWFGAGSCMGVAASVYGDDVRSVIPDPIAAGISLILAGIFVVGFLRKYKCLTVTDIIANKYGKNAGIYASFWMLPVYIGWLGAQVLGIGTLLNLLTGVSPFWGIIVGAAIVLIYTTLGGMWAVTLTDVVQVTLIIFGILIVIPGAMEQAGGITHVLNEAHANGQLSLLPKADYTFNQHIGYIGNWIIMGLGCIVGQDLVQRSLAAKTPEIAKQSSIYSGILYLLIGLVPITIGLAAKILFVKWFTPEQLVQIASGDLENSVLPYVAYRVLSGINGVGPIVMTLFFSALIAAIMSSADSSLLAASSLFTNNILRPLCPKLSNKTLLMSTRISAVLFLVGSVLLALTIKSIYVLMTNAWASQLVVVFLPVVAAIYLPHSKRFSAWACMLTATIVWIGYAAWVALQTSFSGTYEAAADLLESDAVTDAFSAGAVYGFVSGAIVFFAVYLWEKRCVHEPDTSPICSDGQEEASMEKID